MKHTSLVFTVFLFLLCWGTLNAQPPFRISETDSPKGKHGMGRSWQEHRSCIGPRGKIYITWLDKDKIYVQRSVTGENSFLEKGFLVYTIKSPSTGFVNKNEVQVDPKISCDRGAGEFKDRFYLIWSDEKNGSKNKDVFLCYSNDQGVHWTEPFLLTYRPNHRNQFQPDVAVDKKTGELYVLYFDQQNYTDEKYCDIYMGISKNGGLKFDRYRLNEHPIAYNKSCKLLLQENGEGIQPLWTLNSKKWFTVQWNDSLFSRFDQMEAIEEMEIERSFVFSDRIKMEFNLKTAGKYSVVITKPLDPKFELKLVEDKAAEEGKQSIEISMEKLGLKKDNYIVTFYYNRRNTFVWITEE